jgi:hypothetical protein
MKKGSTLNWDRLVEWFEGDLSDDEAAILAAQLVADGEAQLDEAWLRQFYQASQNVVLADPPTAVTDRLEQRFAIFAQNRRPPSLYQRLLASLSFDSHLTLVRGARTAASVGDQRQLVYATDLATVALTLQKRDQEQKYDLLGQLLLTKAGETDLVRVLLLKEESEFDSTLTDDLGEFTLTALPAGSYDLILSSEQYEIKIPALHLSV